jgi:hypothetical protein
VEDWLGGTFAAERERLIERAARFIEHSHFDAACRLLESAYKDTDLQVCAPKSVEEGASLAGRHALDLMTGLIREFPGRSAGRGWAVGE